MMSAGPASDSKAKMQFRPSQFSKTKLCRFQLLGICAKGIQCPFAHGDEELKPLPDLRCTKLCRQLLTEGQCTTPNCSYAHRREELRSATSAKGDANRQKIKRGRLGKEAAPGPSSQGSMMMPPGLEEWNGPIFDAFAPAMQSQAATAMAADPKDMSYLRDLFPDKYGDTYGMSMPPPLGKMSDMRLGLPSVADETGEAADAPAYVHVPLRLDEIDADLLKGTRGAADGSSTTDVSETSTVTDEQPIAEDQWMESYGYTADGYTAAWYGNAGAGGDLSGYANFGNEGMESMLPAGSSWGAWHEGAWNNGYGEYDSEYVPSYGSYSMCG